MNINLSEEATSEYISLYENYLEDIQKLNKKVINVFDEVVVMSKYNKLQEQIFKLIDVYNETLVNSIKMGVFRDWEDSEGSLRACLRTYRAGDAADEVCAQIELQMEDLMQDILKIEQPDVIITDRPVVSEDGLEQLEDICRTAQAELQNFKSEYVSKISSKELENDIYGTLRPLIEGVATNMEAFFEASMNSFVELHEFVLSVSQKLQDNIIEQSGEVIEAMDSSINANKKVRKSISYSDVHADCPMWRAFDAKSRGFEMDCNNDMQISFQQREQLLKFFRNKIYVRIENELNFQMSECVKRFAAKNNGDKINVNEQKVLDLCMWENCKRRNGFKENNVWSGNQDAWRAEKKEKYTSGKKDVDCFAEIDYQKVKGDFLKEMSVKQSWIKQNNVLNDLLKPKMRLNDEINELVEEQSKYKKNLIDRFIYMLQIKDLDNQIGRKSEKLRALEEAIRNERDNKWDNKNNYSLKNYDEAIAIDYIRKMYKQNDDGLIDEELLSSIIDKMPVPDKWIQSEWNKYKKDVEESFGLDAETLYESLDLIGSMDSKKEEYKQFILSELKSYCGVKCDHATNMDLNYRRKLQDRKDNGYKNAAKLFDKYANQIIICSDNEAGTAHFNSSLKGIYFSPAREQVDKREGDTFFHEVGHNIDMLLNRPSESPVFLNAFMKDREQFISKYNSFQLKEKFKFIDDLNTKEYSSLSDLIRGWNIIIICDGNVYHENARLFLKTLDCDGCENTPFLSKAKAIQPYSINNEVMYYSRMSGIYGHNGYDTEPEEDIYYDFYMSINPSFNPWSEKQRTRYQPEREAFAEMYEADMGGNQAKVDLFKEYTPNTWNEYRKIIDQNC